MYLDDSRYAPVSGQALASESKRPTIIPDNTDNAVARSLRKPILRSLQLHPIDR